MKWKKLATIDRDSPVTLDIDDVKREPVDYEKLRQFYEKMNFRKFLAELNASGAGQDGAEVEKVEYTVLNDDNVKDVKATEKDTVEFYLEMLGANYHLADFVGFSLKINDKIYVSRAAKSRKRGQKNPIGRKEETVKDRQHLKKKSAYGN